MIFGICIWFPEHGEHLIAPHDLEEFMTLRPNGKVFQCLGLESGFSTIAYGDKIFHVNQKVMKNVPPPKFLIGQSVVAKEKRAVVVDIEWHFKDLVPIYFLSFEGKRSSRRYYEKELADVAIE
jgi:hypothetical protein